MCVYVIYIHMSQKVMFSVQPHGAILNPMFSVCVCVCVCVHVCRYYYSKLMLSSQINNSCTNSLSISKTIMEIEHLPIESLPMYLFICLSSCLSTYTFGWIYSNLAFSIGYFYNLHNLWTVFKKNKCWL